MIGDMRANTASRMAEDFKALASPARIQALEHLMQAGEPVSPKALATLTGESLGRMSYHVRILVSCEMVELAHTRPRRGAVEHFYVPTRKAKRLYRAHVAIPPGRGRAK